MPLRRAATEQRWKTLPRTFGIQHAAMTTADQSINAQAASPVAVASSALWEWIWRAGALAAARARPKLSWLGRERLRRARLAAELGDRALDPIEPLRAGSSLPLAVSLYREAAYWALIQESEPPNVPATLREAMAGASAELVKIAGGDDKLAAVRTSLADKTFVETAEDAPDVVRRDAELAQTFVYGVIDRDIDRDDRVAAVLVQRGLRVSGALLVAAALLFGLWSVLNKLTQGPDLALGKPWRASSSAYECHPQQNECGGAHSAMFFHTTEEDSPWVEFDLGSPQKLGRVQVVNREDCCPERAVPLVVEVSDDRTHWRSVARATESFRDWEMSFDPVKARYLRLRVDRRSLLHLVRVSVWSK
jgi:hypothetical protein